MTAGVAYLRALLERAAALGITPGDPLRAARTAWQLGEHDLGRALLARAGGLLDAADARRTLGEALPAAVLDAAAARLGVPPTAPAWTDTQREMFVRVLAAYALHDDPLALPLPGPSAGGLRVLPVQGDAARWTAGLHALRHATGHAPGVPPSTWVSATWGGRWGLTRTLRAHGAELPAAHDHAGQEGSVSVDATEQLIATLSAAYAWNLPRLVRLLTRPLVIDAPHGLRHAQLGALTGLLDDAAQVFGWTVLLLPGIDRAWPAAFRPADAAPAPAGAPGPTPCTLHVRDGDGALTLEELAREVRARPGRTLVMLPSRGSAARLTGLLDGATLLSTSLCPAHLDDVADALAAAPSAVVVATTLPASTVARFDRVYHAVAPLPYLAEAARLCGGELHVLALRDVAVPLAWTDHVRRTVALLHAHPDALADPARQRAYFEGGPAAPGDAWADDVTARRRAQDYVSFAASVLPRAEHSVPVLVPYDDAARAAIARYRASGWLPASDLRYAAWLTPSEAVRAVRARDAESAGWSLIWTAAYDLRHGLAARTVADVRAG